MTGLVRSAKIKTLERLYEQKGIKFNPRVTRELSTHQLRDKINKVRGFKIKGGGSL